MLGQSLSDLARQVAELKREVQKLSGVNSSPGDSITIGENRFGVQKREEAGPKDFLRKERAELLNEVFNAIQSNGPITITASSSNLLISVVDFGERIDGLESTLNALVEDMSDLSDTLEDLESDVSSILQRLENASGSADLTLNCSEDPPTITGTVTVTI